MCVRACYEGGRRTVFPIPHMIIIGAWDRTLGKQKRKLLKRMESCYMTGRLLALKQTWDLPAAGLQGQSSQQELKSVAGEMPKRWCFGQWVNRGCQLPNPLSVSTAKWIAREINQRRGNSLRKKTEDLMYLNYCRSIV